MHNYTERKIMKIKELIIGAGSGGITKGWFITPVKPICIKWW
jgi:hypothetical protein